MAIEGARRDAGGRFLNGAGELGFADPTVTLPFLARRIGSMLTGRSGHPATVANDGSFLRENARHSVPTVTWVGHATLLVQMDHASFLTDPIWSERASPVGFTGPKRAQPPGLRIEDLPPIDFVLVSHDHYDHLDVDTLARLAQRDPHTLFVVPLENAATLRGAGVSNLVELDWGGSVEIAGLRVVCLPAQHWSGRGLLDRRVTLWSSYAVRGPEHRFFFAGDTGYFPGFAEIGAAHGPFDLAAMPIGAYAPVEMMQHWHMSPEEALQASRDVQARRIVPVHYGTFDLSDESPDEPPRRLMEAAAAGAIAPEDVYLLKIGETRPF
ncbi:MAG: MBL fold metallo-hydrolase [Deltaproteobacteria bacterium]|nr:MBL fold metallo-hydrolase [Deltaproteobacteria bacterium]